ncbi:DUF637 domain-containing protein, partial [Pseudomonas aeruginosa]|uniref:DUF637 domain-containing protein n=1 Tax=Pseudomonas aeruginosa TaxID=287 RepID=UPI002E18D056|nr:DUF637 domain-containing protein [Pseudomonas aeruginosa]
PCAAQVAALTHDIVWLEEVEVNGEKVLAPVVYLAQAEGRLGPNGALIQGRDVNLITGGDLRNAGTLRAQNDLSATAGNIDNSGLIEAGNRLDLLASGSIRNDQGGIIAGREVSLSALTRDVINERTVTQHQSSYRGTGTTEAFADSAARIEAAQKLTVSAGRDVANIGGVIDSKGDLALQGGRDVLVSAAVAERGWTAGSQAYQTQTTQMGAEVVAGRDISVSAGRDISVVGSRIDARRDVTFEAGRDVGLVAAANEEHAYGKTKKVTFQDDKITQQATRVDAGGDLAINAGQDLRLVASQASAGDEAYLVAGDKLELLAANDSSYYLYDKKSKGSFGSKKTRRDEITDVTAVGSQISSGGDLTLLSGGDQTYQGAKLESGNDLAIVSGGAVTFDAVKDLHQESHEKSKGDLAWQSSKGKGQTDETVRQSQLVAQGNLAIKAVEGLKIDLKHIDQKTVSQTIDAMVQADPQLAWLKQMEQRGDVDWRRVQELHDSWKYSNSGLGVGAQLAIAIVVTYFTAGAASGAIATAGAGTSMAGATAAATATTSAGWLNAAGTAALSGVASNGAISTINNRGNLGDVVKDVTSSDALRGYVVAGTTAGLTAGVYDKWTSTQTGTSTALPNTGAVAPAAGLGTWQGVGQFTSNQLLQNGTSVLLDRALGGKGSLGDALQNSLANAFAAYGFKLIGDTTHGVLDDGSLGKIGLHALMGGLAAEAAGGDFRTGALAAGVNEALVDSLAKQYASLPIDDKKGLLTMSSQLIGMLAASTQGDADAKSLQTGAWVAGNATQNNYIEHSDVLAFAEDMRSCGKDEGCQKDKWEKERYSDESKLNVQEAQNTYGPLRAKEKRLQIVESMDTLVSIQCVTSRCESYKTELLEQSVDSYIHLSKVLDEWVPTLDRLALIGGAAAGKQIDSKVKRPGMPEPVELAQVQKAVDYLAALKATGASGKPLVSKGSEVTPEVIQKALQGDRVITAQGAVSLPAVQRYVDRLLKGDVAPAIKMDGNVIVDGNHRYIAAKILGRNLDVTPGSLSPNKVHQTKPVSELKIDQVDWGNK